ncbi:unnamed protein product, partial [Symbiodinium sp. CCMP2592]
MRCSGFISRLSWGFRGAPQGLPKALAPQLFAQARWLRPFEVRGSTVLLRWGRRSAARGSSPEDAWATAKDVAEKTRHAALAEEIDGRLVSEWLEGQATDLKDYEAFFRATEASSKPTERSSVRESWLQPLLEPLSAHGRKEALRAQAAEEGVRIFDIKEGDSASE